MMGIVAINGLRGYVTKFSYQYRANDTVIPEEEPGIIKAPMMMRFLYSDPETPEGPCKIYTVLLVSLPRFGLPGEDVDKEGFVTSKLPDTWVRGK